MSLASSSLTAARDLIRFIDASPSPHHAVAEVVRRLQAQGFAAFDERAPFACQAGTRGYVVRGASVIGFVLGSAPPAEAGFFALGAHTDSPNLRLKPQPSFENAGFRQLSVEVYGGVLLTTWLDRDLGLAGRVTLADGSQPLVRIDDVICRVPNLAIHLNREVNKDGLHINPQTQLQPVLGLESGVDFNELLGRALGRAGVSANANDVLGFDLGLFDLQPGVLAGSREEFIFSARLDNLASCHAAVSALLENLDPAPHTRVIALYDHEEVGSQSATGARSQLLESVFSRLASAAGATPDALDRASARSLFVSADMAHGVHPNYTEKHDKLHRPMLGQGPVIKVNHGQSYATNDHSQADFVRACRAAGVTPQYFSSRNDIPCGSTIGPISAARLGIRTVDVGNPMLSMHSCREMAASADVEPMIRALSAVLRLPLL
jgi:aspartyl aminopeptidase